MFTTDNRVGLVVRVRRAVFAALIVAGVGLGVAEPLAVSASGWECPSASHIDDTTGEPEGTPLPLIGMQP